MQRSLLASVMIAGATVGLVRAESVSLNPSQDTSLFSEGELSNGVGVHLFSGATAPKNGNALRRALLAFELDSIPAGAEIVSASLTLRMNKTIVGPQDMSLHRLLSDWGEGESDAIGQEGRGTAAENGDATWMKSVFPDTAWTNEGGDFSESASAVTPVSGSGFYTWTGLESDIQNWLTSPQTNFGWILIGQETSVTAKRFDSREATNAANRPTLNIEFELGGPLGDFDGNRVLDVADIDALTAEVIAGTNDISLDVTNDGLVNQDDRTEWISNLRGTFLGDSNLDGEFGSADLVAVFTANTYEDGIVGNSTWGSGDWNGDAEFDTSDLVAAFVEGAYEKGPKAVPAVVPEPSFRLLSLVCFALLAFRSRA